MKRGAIRKTAMPLLLAALIQGCAASSPELTPDTAGKVYSYTLGAGDKLHITVYNEPSLSNDFVVTASGNISFPLIGNIDVAGKSIEDTQALLRTRLAEGYINDPRVTIEVATYRPYFIMGEVGRPGQYPYSTGLTITQAVAIAGGFSYRANERVVFVKRANDPVEHKIDVSKYMVYVRPGDTIRIGERYF